MPRSGISSPEELLSLDLPQLLPVTLLMSSNGGSKCDSLFFLFYKYNSISIESSPQQSFFV